MEIKMKNSRPILLIEDDIVDQMSVKRAVKQLAISNPLKIAENGEEAIEYLKNSKNELPAFILLDLNMPRLNGIEFLSIIKNDLTWKRIPVIVLTTSREDSDRISSYSFSVAGYVLKPVDYDKFVDVVRIIRDYWVQNESPY